MADRVSASITIGGEFTNAQLSHLAGLIQSEGLGLDWDKPSPTLANIPVGEPLRLFAHEVAWGFFPELEDWCRKSRVPYIRWSGSYPGSWRAGRVVFTGVGKPTEYDCDEDDRVVVTRQMVERLDSIDAVLAHFDAANFAVPPLILVD